MKALKVHMNILIVSLAEVAVGILLLINPSWLTGGIIISIGIIAMLLGIKSLIRYFRADAEEASGDYRFFLGLSMIIVGLLFVLVFNKIINAAEFLTIVYGIPMLLTGVLKLQWTVDSLRLKKSAWYFPAASALLAVVCGIIIFLCDSFYSSLWTYISITLILSAVIDFLTIIAGDKKAHFVE